MKHLLGIEDLSKDDIEKLLEKGRYYAQSLETGDWDKQRLKHKIILTLFYENSTRTLTSFDMAAKRLGAEVVIWHPKISSIHKDENFTDTIDTLSAMKPDGIVIRHSEYGAPNFVAGRVECPVINGGDSWRAHPSQALLDALTIQQAKGKLEGLQVAICGDIAHSRVARSNAVLLDKMGASVRLVAPPSLIPEKFPVPDLPVFSTMEEGLENCDVIMMLRIQKERLDASMVPDPAAYCNQYGLTHDRVMRAAADVVILHPGPMNRGIEIADDVADDPHRSLIRKQVSNGIPMRMAILDLLVST